jgi:DNA-3-methyladenine glycosylase
MSATASNMVIPVERFRNHDVFFLARYLLGKLLMTRDPLTGVVTGGIITETEAYAGVEDKACHAYGGRRTERTEVLYKEGGCCYVYLCYGMHHLLNIVVGEAGQPHCVLIRAIEPTHGLDLILQRRKKTKVDRQTASGPGLLTQALGITKSLTGESLDPEKSHIWIEHLPEMPDVSADRIVESARVGVAYAGAHAKFPWRYRIKGSNFTSPAK